MAHLGIGEYLTKYEAVPVSASARSLVAAIYDNAIAGLVTVDISGGAVRFRVDGTTVTATSGVILNPGESLALENATQISNFSVISDDGSNTTVRAEYYRRVLDTLSTLSNDATPSVLSNTFYVTGGTTTITDFDDGVVDQTIEILSAHAITITDGTNMLLEGSRDFVMAAGDSLTLRMFNDQVWEEVSRKTNLAGLAVVATLANDATPTVLNGRSFITGGTTTITDFDDGVVGQTLEILSAHAITITDASNILLEGSRDFVMAAGDSLTLHMFNVNVWEEVSRKTNTIGIDVLTTLDDTGTPSVLNGKYFVTGGTTAITDFDDGVVGQTIKVLSAHTVTLTDGAAVDLAAGSNYSMTATDTVTLTMYNDQVWVEDARSVNGG